MAFEQFMKTATKHQMDDFADWTFRNWHKMDAKGFAAWIAAD